MIGALRHLAIMGVAPSLQRLCAFSIMTMAASTMAPMAMAMPESDMMLASTPWSAHDQERGGDAERQGDDRHQRRAQVKQEERAHRARRR
jgi:hypothetical protein